MDKARMLLDVIGREKGEALAAWRACVDYLLMDRRSLAALLERYQSGGKAEAVAPTVRRTTLHKWSSRWSWQERAKRLDEAWALEEVREWDAKRRELAIRGWEDGGRLRDWGMAMLDEVDPTAATAVKAVETGDKLQRLAAGEPTERTDHNLLESMFGFLDRVIPDDRNEDTGEV